MKNKYYKTNKVLENQRKTKCIICGEDAKCCLEFHHLRDKLYNISQSVKFLPPNLFKKNQINVFVYVLTVIKNYMQD